MRDRMTGGAGRRGRRGFLVGPWWLILGVLLAAVPMPPFAQQVSVALLRSDIPRVKVGNDVYSVFLYRTGQDLQGHSAPPARLPDGFAFIRGAAWRLTDSTARTGGLWFALHRVRDGRDYCGLFPADRIMDYEDLLAQLGSVPGISKTNQWAGNRPLPVVLAEIGGAIGADVEYAEWSGPSDLHFPNRESLVRALFPGCTIQPWDQIAAPAVGEMARGSFALNSNPAGGVNGPAGTGSVAGVESPVSATVIQAPVGGAAPGGARGQVQGVPAKADAQDPPAMPTSTETEAHKVPASAQTQAGPSCGAPLGVSLDLWVRVLAVISGSALLALCLALFHLRRRAGSGPSASAPPPVPDPPVVPEDALTLGATKEQELKRLAEVFTRLVAGLGTLESAVTELRSRREVSPDLPAPSHDLRELLGLCRDIRAAVGDEPAARLDGAAHAALDAARRGEEAARQLTGLAAQLDAGEQERRASAVQVESLRAANAGLEATLGACRRWLIADLQAAGYLNIALDPGGADLAQGMLDEAAGLWLRDARERPELQRYVRRLIGLRDYLGAAEVQRLPHFAAAGLDGLQERLCEKSTFRALYQSVTLREALRGQWHHIVQSIFRALLLLDSYWPGSTDPELRARLAQCVEAAERTLAEQGIQPHRLELPVDFAWIAERASWAEEALQGIAAPLKMDPEFQARIMGPAAAAPTFCDVAAWGYDLANETDSARPSASKSLLIAMGPAAAWR